MPIRALLAAPTVVGSVAPPCSRPASTAESRAPRTAKQRVQTMHPRRPHSTERRQRRKADGTSCSPYAPVHHGEPDSPRRCKSSDHTNTLADEAFRSGARSPRLSRRSDCPWSRGSQVRILSPRPREQPSWTAIRSRAAPVHVGPLLVRVVSLVTVDPAHGPRPNVHQARWSEPGHETSVLHVSHQTILPRHGL